MQTRKCALKMDLALDEITILWSIHVVNYNTLPLPPSNGGSMTHYVVTTEKCMLATYLYNGSGCRTGNGYGKYSGMFCVPFSPTHFSNVIYTLEPSKVLLSRMLKHSS